MSVDFSLKRVRYRYDRCFEKGRKIGVGTLRVIGWVVLVVFMGISYKISVRVMEKKEF